MMVHISIAQALGVWSDLESAYYGKNKYGGDEAEIYTYRLMENRPSFANMQIDSKGLFGDDYRKAVDQANIALHDLLVLFLESKSETRIEIDGQEFGPWLRTARNPHRFHVKVIRAEKKIGPPNLLCKIDEAMPSGNLQWEIRKALEQAELDPLTYVSVKDGEVYFHEEEE